MSAWVRADRDEDSGHRQVTSGARHGVDESDALDAMIAMNGDHRD
jgi:hypothetical protein